jgi:acylphosphatase
MQNSCYQWCQYLPGSQWLYYFLLLLALSAKCRLPVAQQVNHCRRNQMNLPLSPDRKTLRLVIYGRVQGVFFRQSMQREAQYLAIWGWVRNRSDGTVEAVVHGGSAAVDAIVRWARRGPQMASVERVDISPDTGCYEGFEIR